MPYAVQALAIFVALLLYFYYFVRVIRSETTRLLATGTGCMVLLMLPLGFERLRLGTMAACSGAFMASLQLVRLMHQTSREDRIDWTLRGFILRFFRDLVPIVSVPYSQRRSPRRFMRESSRLLARSLVDLYLTNVTWMWLVRCLGPGVDVIYEGYILDVIYSTAFFLHLFSGTMFSYHMQRILVPALTADRFQVKEIYLEPLLSSSPRDFWSRRFNTLLQERLKETVFDPLRGRCGAPAAAFAVFVTTGVCHMYVVWVMFRTRYVHALVFFLLHWLACAIESAFIRTEGRAPVRFFNWFTWALFGCLTLPLYMGTYMRTAPLVCAVWLSRTGHVLQSQRDLRHGLGDP